MNEASSSFSHYVEPCVVRHSESTVPISQDPGRYTCNQHCLGLVLASGKSPYSSLTERPSFVPWSSYEHMVLWGSSDNPHITSAVSTPSTSSCLQVVRQRWISSYHVLRDSRKPRRPSAKSSTRILSERVTHNSAPCLSSVADEVETQVAAYPAPDKLATAISQRKAVMGSNVMQCLAGAAFTATVVTTTC